TRPRHRPETFYLWYRTGPTTLLPLGNDNSVTRANPPLMRSGMTRTVVGPLGRLSELVAVPAPAQQDAPLFTNWALLFDLAGIPMDGFTPSPSTGVPPVHAAQRTAWEGRIPETPEQSVRGEAGATGGE